MFATAAQGRILVLQKEGPARCNAGATATGREVPVTRQAYPSGEQTTAHLQPDRSGTALDSGRCGPVEPVSPISHPRSAPSRRDTHTAQSQAADSPGGQPNRSEAKPQPNHSHGEGEFYSRYPLEFWGLPGFEDSPWLLPWYRYNWCGRRPAKVWSPVTWEGRTWCQQVLAMEWCVYCGGPVEVIDHIVPTARGGENEVENLAPACVSCNAAKGAKPLLRFLLDRLPAEPIAKTRCAYIRANGERCRSVYNGTEPLCGLHRRAVDAVPAHPDDQEDR